MKKSKILFILLVAIFSTVFSLRVNAATSFPNQITTSIVAWDPVVVNLGGGYTASVVKKHYSDGKVFCTLFKYKAPTGTCTAVDWNSDATENKKIAVAVGEMINETRNQSSNTDGTVDWETYLYSEMAINYFLYLNNGKNADNNVAAIQGAAKWAKISSNDKYKAIYAAGETAYKDYGNSRVEYSNPKITLSEDKSSVTATVELRCYDGSGNLTGCNANVRGALTLTGTTTNGQNINTTSASSSYRKTSNVYYLTYSYSLTNDTFKASDETTKNYITATFRTTNKSIYNSAQNYKCASNKQNVTPNLLVDVEDSKQATISTKTYYSAAPQVTCTLSIDKYNSTQGSSVKLKGASFELYADANKTDKVGAATTNANGSATFTGLEPGTYYLKETKAPTGFAINDEYADGKAVTLAVGENNTCATSLSIGNGPVTGGLVIKKVDDKNQFVVGAKIKVYTISSNTSASEDLEVTDADSEETAGTSKVNKNYTFNYLKFDANGNYDPNGEFDYFISNGSVNTITGLALGTTYYVVEDAVPENSSYAIKVGYDSQTIKEAKNYEIILVNITSEFKVSKQAIAGSEELPGAKLEIFFANGISTGWSWESTDKPQEIVGLADGDYILVETTAPDGYEKAESINFTIEDGKLKDDDDNILVMKDKEIVDVPDTFTTTNIVTMIVGLLLVTGGSVALAYEYKKRKTA